MPGVVVEYMLYDGMNTEGQLFRVNKNNTVRFLLDVGLTGLHVRFFINYPSSQTATFKRTAYRELKIINPTVLGKSADCFDNYFELSSLPISGSFHFYFSKDGSSPDLPIGDTFDKRIAGSGYIIVDPHFSGSSSRTSLNTTIKEWDLSGIVLQSYLSKNLGEFTDWESRLIRAKETSYNMIHFTPLQELGYSRSAYSLKDQLKVNPEFTPPGASKPVDWPDIENFIKYLETEWNVFSMTDLVYNHTSSNSPWVHEHPECAYNVVNSPHLAPAYLLDHIVWQMTVLTSQGKLIHEGIPKSLENPDSELPAMRHWLEKQIEAAKLYEFFMANIDIVVKEFVDWLLSGKSDSSAPSFTSKSSNIYLKIDGPRKGKRLGATVDFSLARHEFVGTDDHAMPLTPAAAEVAANHLKERLYILNEDKKNEIKYHLQVAIDNVLANARYRFYDPYGMKLKNVTTDTPIMWTYFYHPVPDLKTLEEAENVLNTPKAAEIMAYNGWVMNDDPLRNFAESNSFVYLRRELVVWGDSVKLRYGKCRDDCPYLWDRMEKYTELTARIFHAVRLDNCHSTPLHVAQHMLDCGRAIRPNLYVVAELFTGGEHLDNIFINKLGINSLIRESLSAHDCHKFGEQIYRFGVSRPAGAFLNRPGTKRLYPCVAHAVLYDQTHDNPSVLEKHSIYNYIPLSALGSFAYCATGSTCGYDELVPHYIDVVKEERKYAQWPNEVNTNTGIIKVRSIFNELHQWLSSQGFTETFVDQVTNDILALTRFCPETREAVILIAHTAFQDPGPKPRHTDFKSIHLGGKLNRVLCELLVSYNGIYPPQNNFRKNPQFINGLEGLRCTLSENIPANKSKTFHVESYQDEHGVVTDRLTFHNFPPGSVVVVSVRLTDLQQQALADLHNLITQQFGWRLHEPRESISMGKGEKAYTPLSLPARDSLLKPNTLRIILGNMSLFDLNKAMFRCAAEEIADGLGRNAYNIPGWGDLVYCGFQSLVTELKKIRDKNDLGHPICGHLRQGDWLAHYLINRLSETPQHSNKLLTDALKQLGEAVKLMYSPLQDLPRYLVPAYFEILTMSVNELLQTEVELRLASWIRTSSSLIKRLAVATTQFYGYIGNCRLPGRTIPSSRTLNQACTAGPIHSSLAAGLPHFAEGMWRCWGRDTFISLRGCLLLPGRFQEAANIILSYASLLRHGLIPNLTGDGYTVNPRYNCRDAVWYWLYSIVCYEQEVLDPDAHASAFVDRQHITNQSEDHKADDSAGENFSLLDQPVWRWFPGDDTTGWPGEYLTSQHGRPSQRIQTLHEVMQEALQCHATGIEFNERDAGPRLDEHMKPEGFKVQADIDPNTGFPRGGNPFNCGTWMDKMGSSSKANNEGIPATPRDGSAVELVGLAYAVVSWLEKSHHNQLKNGNYYPHAGVQLPSGQFFTWNDWAERIKSSFESKFWIPSDTNDPALKYNGGIYRDCVGSSAGYTDNQLRPNFLVAMTLAPEIFTPERAWNALEIVKQRIVGPLGMRTLSKDDFAYRGFYDNSNDSDDYAVSHGFNYHQGPEWLWPTGFYLRARLKIANILSKKDPNKWGHLMANVNAECQQSLARLDAALQSSPWMSLPELTNADGQYCKDSCQAQAWSVGCILEAAYELIFPKEDRP